MDDSYADALIKLEWLHYLDNPYTRSIDPDKGAVWMKFAENSTASMSGSSRSRCVSRRAVSIRAAANVREVAFEARQIRERSKKIMARLDGHARYVYHVVAIRAQ